MDERHLYFAALVASPWLAIGGAALLASALAGELAWCQLRAIAAPTFPAR